MCLRTGMPCLMFSMSLQWFERHCNNLSINLWWPHLNKYPKLFKCKCLSLKSEDESLNIFFLQCGLCNFLEKKRKKGKKNHRIFSLYQLGAIQYYKCASEGKKSTRERSFVMLLLLQELVSFLPKIIFLRPPKAIATEQCWNDQLKMPSFQCTGKCSLINNPWVRWQLSLTVFRTGGLWRVWPVADLRLPPGCSLVW